MLAAMGGVCGRVDERVSRFSIASTATLMNRCRRVVGRGGRVGLISFMGKSLHVRKPGLRDKRRYSENREGRPVVHRGLFGFTGLPPLSL
jgi:hypothetical protein